MGIINNIDSKSSVVDVLPDIINRHIAYLHEIRIFYDETFSIYGALRKFLNGNYEKYIFNEKTVDEMISNKLSDSEFQNILANLNEKEGSRKSKGVYYTPKDVTSYIIENCFYQQVSEFNGTLVQKSDELTNFVKSNSEKLYDLIFRKTIFDPTCGTGEFLINALDIKIDLLKNSKFSKTSDDYIKILSTINGNDINIESVEIIKIRLFFKLVKKISDATKYLEIAEVLNKHFHNYDFLNLINKDFEKYDVIIGNPPYVEDRQLENLPETRFGNIYANVLKNSIQLLTADGILGFIIPLSYISTPRMRKIRSYIENKMKYQIVLNYADRPDCLFASVHQKLSILIASKGKAKHTLYTNGYNYWYKAERNNLFNNIEIQKNKYLLEGFYPKIGNSVELNIFEKIFTTTDKNIYKFNIDQLKNNVYLNMRACFWIKAFSFNPGSREYKGFAFEGYFSKFIICLQNSSLFFWFWNTISDCWHITIKELKHFYIPHLKIDINQFSELAKRLESKLEKTKKYIRTKQTDYEYKHNKCKDIIDEIDDTLAIIYNLTDNELNYIKNYSIKYRESRGV